MVSVVGGFNPLLFREVLESKERVANLSTGSDYNYLAERVNVNPLALFAVSCFADASFSTHPSCGCPEGKVFRSGIVAALGKIDKL